eukprot:s1541_g7.t1
MGPKAMKSAKGNVMKTMKVMKAMKVKVMKQVKQVKPMKVNGPVTSTGTKKFAHFIVKMTKKDKKLRFQHDLQESFQEWDDVKNYNRSYRVGPPCTWNAWVKSDMAERGWLYVKGKATSADSWHLITSQELPY